MELGSSAIDVRVERTDAMTRACELLVVKYAQAPHGLDRQVAIGLGLSPTAMPGVGDHLVVSARGQVPAQTVLFLGVPVLYEFDYQSIRDFGRRALSTAAEVRPQTRELCLTVHGPGYGLDEIEAFHAEVAGLHDAIAEGAAPTGLEVVTFLEVDDRRAQRLHAELSTLLPQHQIHRPHPGGGWPDPGVAERLRSVGFDSRAKRHAFVAMPFSSDFEDTFHFGIAPPIRGAGFVCERIDNLAFTGDIVLTMKERIGNASFVVADLTGANANVYLEVGYAWGRYIPTVLICRDAADLKFDIRGQRCLIYGSIRELEQKLSEEIATLFR